MGENRGRKKFKQLLSCEFSFSAHDQYQQPFQHHTVQLQLAPAQKPAFVSLSNGIFRIIRFISPKTKNQFNQNV